MSTPKLLKTLTNPVLSKGFHTSKSRLEAAVIDGQKIASQILEETKCEIDKWVQAGGKRPKLVAILVGEDPASKTYVQRKMKAAEAVGIESETLTFNSDISQEELLCHIHELNENQSVDGLLVQLPVPKHMNQSEVCNAVSSSKDVDGFHPKNVGKLSLNHRSIIPATALGVKELILRSKIPTLGKNAVVIGRSKHVGLPIALLLHSDGSSDTPGLDMTTTICHRYTPRAELERLTKLADFVVSCAGVPGLITEEMIKPGACVIDVGISRIRMSNGKFRLIGDVNYEAVKKVAGYITPVPGGVGPMTVAMLMKNTLFALQLKQGSESLTKYSSIVA
ncbi:hypothetical protein QAD02_015751 [Eretmocerus hayati]|uniref:Uncharacterized protein n=1 Tax=Eretmocerus hayati TaxID=131215 RepID=A0ACC2P9J0_9HYME|nr:hypothetical protein QAD02_015751 [Eretmocerus hayati]